LVLVVVVLVVVGEDGGLVLPMKFLLDNPEIHAIDVKSQVGYVNILGRVG
jgi:hypothetical protein